MADERPEASNDGHGLSFAAFVLSLAHTTAVHLGDVPDPVSGESGHLNLAAAQQMIDILSLLEQKTRGNLTAEERQLLEQLLYELRLRFVEVRNAGGDSAGGGRTSTDQDGREQGGREQGGREQGGTVSAGVPPSGSRTPSGIIIP